MQSWVKILETKSKLSNSLQTLKFKNSSLRIQTLEKLNFCTSHSVC